MLNQSSLFLWSLPAGRFAGVQLRVSWFMPLIVVWLLVQFPLLVALLLTGCLVLSVLLHEIGHVVAARWLGLHADEILLWPLGGLAAVEPTRIPRVDFLVASAGPLVNLILVTATLPVVVLSGVHWPEILNPAAIPVASDLAERGVPFAELCEILFAMNWILLLANLIPALPLDGGRMLRAVLSSRYSPSTANEWAFRIAVGAGVTLTLVAMLFLKSTVLMGLGTFILLGAILEWTQMQLTERRDDSFLGYDFSQGYTSLDRGEPVETRSKTKSAGPIRRWLDKRRGDRLERLKQEEQAAEAQLDTLLEKVHEHGMQSLTPSERRTLEQASQRIRTRNRPTE